MKNKTTAEQHFDKHAEDYDHHKKVNWYYYKNLKRIPLKYLPDIKNHSILEVGCGTGQIIASLNPRYGVGIDISRNMIDIANRNHKGKKLRFFVDNIENLKLKGKFDYIIMTDVVEHLSDFDKAAKNMRKCMHKGSMALITTPSPLWSPVMELAEKLKLKFEEGPHRWTSLREMEKVLKSNRFKVEVLDTALLVPKYLPKISDKINESFGKIPFIRKAGLIQIVVATI